MISLVDYSSSDGEEEELQQQKPPTPIHISQPHNKRRRQQELSQRNTISSQEVTDISHQDDCTGRSNAFEAGGNPTPLVILGPPGSTDYTEDDPNTSDWENGVIDSPEQSTSRPGSRTSRGRRGIAGGRGRLSGNEEWITLEPMPGGPTNPEVLVGYRGHVAHSIWENSAYHKPLKTHTRDKAQHRWVLSAYDPELPWVQLVKNSGLSHVSSMLFQRPNAALITAFVERWHPETNSFHMPFGEMTITLHDVSAILGLNITGTVVRSFDNFEDQELKSRVIFKAGNKQGVFLSGIKSVCDSEEISQPAIARAFLWYLLGSTLFPDKSGSYVSYQYIHLLGDLEEVVPNYAWGAATLAYLYYQLGVASRKDAKQITGCLTLLECWIYEYFPLFSGVQSVRWLEGRPRALRWGDNNTRMQAEKDLLIYRQQIDNIKSDEILWTPFGPPCTIPPSSLYHGCIRFMGFNEAYMPDRVSRQFGRVQCIPRPIIELGEGTKLAATARSYKKVYGNTDVNWMNLAQHCFAPIDMGAPAEMANLTVPEYMDWYVSRSHVKVHNPAHGVTEASTTTMYSASQQRLQPLRKKVISLSKKFAEDSSIPTYVREGLEDLRRLAGTGGLPGVHPMPMNEWWGDSGKRPGVPCQTDLEPTSLLYPANQTLEETDE
ncbi:hypothetical protein LIER_21391 [Lithospermum erythrorhizon]|uniref:Aminotransferase-like plant mobile domain-containing protein n=1 Tax=Lithospermum erythrorhizon TaxID=34254 RepID=A0AAV3QT87_LITER